MRCPKCGADNPENGAACVSCLAPLATAGAPRVPAGRKRRRLWPFAVLLLVVLLAGSAGAYVWLYGLLPAGAVLEQLGERVEQARTLYLVASYQLGHGQPIEFAQAIEKPDHVWTKLTSPVMGDLETMCDGEKTYGLIAEEGVYWMTPSPDYAQTAITQTLAGLGSRQAARQLGWGKLEVSKSRVERLRLRETGPEERCYVLRVRAKGAESTIHVSTRSLLPLRTVLRDGQRQTIEYRQFALDEPLPKEVRFTPPAGARQVELKPPGTED